MEPATCNTINECALGIADTYALDLLAEALGLGLPIFVLPFVNAGLAAHFAYERNTRDLIAASVTFVDREPHEPGTGGLEIPTFPWAAALAPRPFGRSLTDGSGVTRGSSDPRSGTRTAY